MPNRNLLLTLLAAAVLPLSVAACGGKSNDSGGGGGGKLSLVAYSTPKEAYASVIPAFQKTPAGQGVTFSQSYGASGDQSRAVASGLPADVVAFSLAPDVEKLVKKNLVAKNWANDPYQGFVTNSVVVFAVRKGNPKNIKTWADLTKPGVEVLEPNPFTSGGAKWNVMAAYGAQVEQGKTPAQANDYLKKLFKNVVVQDKSARDALQTFSSGKGDVLLAYENEAITAQGKGENLDYVVPDQTILIQNPIAVTSDAKNPTAAKAFVSYVRTPAAQRIFASKGYRPVVASANDPRKFPTPPGLFKIDKFGGWSKVNDQFFDPDKGSVAEIERGLGVSTG
ncbi:MAG: sulfate/thiosulfate transport system substrate-binding protein [Solirubrobacteraceae bacterium]|jgi:sulfate transport system substrate-binding protein|nr:sulfate/thiosulfate transport system substrate-binding protein [Solirubrobacteraceae bacterium]